MSYGKGSDLTHRFWVWGQSFRIKCPFLSTIILLHCRSYVLGCPGSLRMERWGCQDLPGKQLGREKGIGLEQAVERALAQDNNYYYAETCTFSTFYIPGSITMLYTQYPNPCICGPIVCLCGGLWDGGIYFSESLV